MSHQHTFAGLRIDTACLNGFPYTGGCDYIRVDGRSLLLLNSIQDRMAAIKPADAHSGSELWFEVITDSGDVAWWFIVSHVWEDMRCLVIGDGLSFRSDLGLSSRDGENSDRRWDLAPFLTPLAAHVECLMDIIKKDPAAYNDYMEAHFPYELRTGRILRRTYRKITGHNPWESVSAGNFKHSVVQFLRRKVEEGNSPATWMLRRMTYRDYIHAWRVASLGRLGIDPSGSEEQAFSKLQPLCDFNVDYDSEEDFRELLELMDRAGTHFWDIDYASLSLYVRRGWDESGWWYRLVLMTHGDAMESALLAALALDEAGIPFQFTAAKNILDDYLGNDILAVGPAGRLSTGIRLSYLKKELDHDTYARLVEAIEWDPIPTLAISETIKNQEHSE